MVSDLAPALASFWHKMDIQYSRSSIRIVVPYLCKRTLTTYHVETSCVNWPSHLPSISFSVCPSVVGCMCEGGDSCMALGVLKTAG